MASDPAPGKQAPFRSTVGIQVSAGVPLVQVPDVVGMNEAEATAALKAVGLQVESTRFFGDRVFRQSVSPGETVEQGTKITILLTFEEIASSRIGLSLQPSAPISRSRAAWRRAAWPTPTPPAPPPCRCSSATRADAGRPGAGRAVHRGLRRARRFLVHPHAVPRERRLPHRGHRRAVDRLDRAQPPPRRPARVCAGVVVHAGSAVGENRYVDACGSCTSEPLPSRGRRPGPPAGVDRAHRGRWQGAGRHRRGARAVRRRAGGPPAGRRLLRHLP